MAKTTIDTRDNREIIMEGLQSLGGYQKSAGDWQMVCCPFHHEKVPSCGIYVSLVKPESLGRFHCFGCNKSGQWNEFATQTNLTPIAEWKNKHVQNTDIVDANMEESLLGSSSLTVNGILKQMGCPEAQPWPEHLDWRGFPGKVISRAGGYIALDNYIDSVQLVFIVRYAGQVRGGVKAVYERVTKNQPGFITSRGPWVSKYGLLFLDQARTILQKREYNFVFLVEGPRDALRLLCNGIPAVAALGAATMTSSKALMLSSLGVDRVYVMPDNDEGGKTFWRTAKKALTGIVPAKRISLPESDKKIDPGNMSHKLLEELVDLLVERHSFIKRRTLI